MEEKNHHSSICFFFFINWIFLYKKRFVFRTSKAQTLGPVRLPETDVVKKYPNATYQVYRDEVTIPLSLLNHKSGNHRLLVTHQGCADSGFCYPPLTDTLAITINKALEMTAVKIVDEPVKARKRAKSSTSETDSSTPYQTLFEDHNLFFIILSFFGFGLLLAFTPCVLPMVPVLSGIIVKHHKDGKGHNPLLLSISYVLGMALTYALVGVVIAAKLSMSFRLGSSALTALRINAR